jgi:hypothetical protein
MQNTRSWSYSAYIAFVPPSSESHFLVAGLSLNTELGVLPGVTQRGKNPRGLDHMVGRLSGVHGGGSRAQDCLFGKAERLNCVYRCDLLQQHITI